MKKSIFIIVALFVATFANAELTPEYSTPVTEEGCLTSTSTLFRSSETQHEFLQTIFPFFIKYVPIGEYDFKFEFLNPFDDYSVYKAINGIIVYELEENCVAATYDIFAVDKLAFLIGIEGMSSSYVGYKIIDEDGNVLLNLQGNILNIAKYGDTWKMLVHNSGNDRVEVYSFPGDGSMPNSSEAISNPSPKHNAKKIVREGQVLVETEKNTYDLRGQEVR